MSKFESVDLNIDYKEICDKVISNKTYWTDRFGIFYTFGASSYIDEKKEYTQYKNIVNNLLYKEFSDVYKKLCDYFGAELNSEIAYPGFHIFDERSYKTQASIHFDAPFLRLPIYKPSFSNPQSFTILLKKPKTGAGLNVWEKINLNNMSLRKQREYMEGKAISDLGKATYIEYELGKMYVHSGSVLHQIANTGGERGEQRITMQGHVIQDGDKKYIYF